MPRSSAGILMYRRGRDAVELFLVHPGGPFWARKDLGAWSIPKGEYEAGEDPLAAARREFQEETGFEARGDFIPLGSLRQPSGKVIAIWAVEGTCDAAAIRSNPFSMEWPPRSGHMAEFPEVDRAGWFTPTEARAKLTRGQIPVVDALLAHLGLEERTVDDASSSTAGRPSGSGRQRMRGGGTRGRDVT